MYNDEICLGDVVRMRKPHPCGNYEWEVVRLGADIGIRCRRCGRRVLLPRSQFVRQVKTLISRGEAALDDAPFNLQQASR
jgi:hypothetical protein